MSLQALLFEGYWPWWLGALALAAIAIGYRLAVGSPLGVSGLLRRVLDWRGERALERSEAGAREDTDAFRAALVAATCRELGVQAQAAEAADPAPPPAPRLPVSAGALFLLMLAAGGLLGALGSGDLALRLALSPDFHARFGTGWGAVAVALGGGVLVGFGTALAGGCTSGHGLDGCARLQPGSLVTTAVFFATGAAVSLALARVLG